MDTHHQTARAQQVQALAGQQRPPLQALVLDTWGPAMFGM